MLSINLAHLKKKKTSYLSESFQIICILFISFSQQYRYLYKWEILLFNILQTTKKTLLNVVFLEEQRDDIFHRITDITQFDEYDYPYLHCKIASDDTVNGPYFPVIWDAEMRCHKRYSIFNVYGHICAATSLCTIRICASDITDRIRSVYVP
jgi:hypothetical protein